MSLRSKVVIESNLKPSKFGKPAALNGSENNDDFEDIYESPLEKSKPSPPQMINELAGLLQELPRNEPEIMAFSNARKSTQGSSNFEEDSRPSSNRNSDERESNRKILTMDKQSGKRNSQRNSDDVFLEGFTNEGFSSSDQNSERELIQDLPTSGNRHNAKIVANEERQDLRTVSPVNNGENGRGPEDNTDVSFRGVINVIKSLDVNRYATKKTIAQGMLDIALLTANASQLKYILQIGKQHEFYILMLSLISVSIGLQVIQGIICVLLGSGLNINKQGDQRKANVWNNICLILMVFTVAVNAVISAFDMRDSSALTVPNATKGASTSLTSGGR